MHVVIIGAYGSAGVAVAEGLVDHVGDAVDQLTLVDAGEPGGGLCILRGCMPSKEVLSAAGHRYQGRVDHRLTGDPHEMDLESVVATKDEHTGNFARHRRHFVEELAATDGVEFVHGTARLVDEHTVDLFEGATVEGDTAPSVDPDAEPTRTVEADYVVVATGSVVNVPDIPGMDEVSYMDSADVLDATVLPDSGVMMGFGYVGLEMAPYLAEAGVDLTVVEHDERPLDQADPRFGDELLSVYREEFGIDVVTNAREQSVERTDDGGVRVVCETHSGHETTLEGEELFLFTGRRPNVDGLDLGATDVVAAGDFVADTMQARDADSLFFVGDVNGKEPILHIAKEQGYLAADNILAHARGDEMDEFTFTTHHVIFSAAGVYPYARIGLTAAEAEEQLDDPIVVYREAADDGVFKTKDAPRGLAELVVDRDGIVRGYQGFHYHADVMAKTMQLAVEMGLDVRGIPDRAYHPTTPEILDGLFRDAKAEL
jgi:pyruvate/2-oxoglutarate dehydrogenase complex dihydrolipoamide dehydrogenase (E3) component